MPEERKLVTILFADVTGSTILGDTLDPEDVRALMSRYYTHARRVIPMYGGTLEKFIGDAVMAVFGLRQANGDDAERALAGALALQNAIATDPVLAPSFSLRIGINTGEVIASNDASRGDFLITGDAVNVAARLQQHANSGEIVVGERTMNATRTAFLFDNERLVELKGKRLPLRVYSLRCARHMRKVERPPFVGRRQDLLQLSVLQARVLEEAQSQLVSIIAPAGTGKSRLIEEFLGRLNADDGFKVATVRCLPYGQTLTYWPLRGLLTGLLGEEIARDKIMQVLMRGGYSEEDAAHITDQALIALLQYPETEQKNAKKSGSLLPFSTSVNEPHTNGTKSKGLNSFTPVIEKDGLGERECIFSAWRLLIEVFAQQTARIIIIEDMHWASDSLLDMIEYILHLRVQAPVLLITLSRPELLDRRPTWGGGRQNFTSLTLQPLTTVQTRELVKQLAQDLSETTREQVVARAGGNPFFALELLRGISERTEPVATPDALPDTVHAAILARLDRLNVQERMVLQVASVISRPVRPAMLQLILDQFTEQELDTALDGLLIRDFILHADGGAFVFRHILIRDVAYGTLSRPERIRLHSKIADCIEANAGEHLDEYAELIAYHYREAIVLARQSAIPLESPIAPEQAIRYLRRAGELAGRSGAFADAYNHLRSAIDIASEAEQATLYEQLGDSLIWGDKSNEAYDKALALWRENGASDYIVGARLLRKLIICHTRGYASRVVDKDYIANLRNEAQKLAEAAGDEDELWRIKVTEIFDYFKYDDALLTAEIVDEQKRTALQAAEHFQSKGDWTAFSEAFDGYAALSMRIGAYKEALEASQRRLTAPELSALEQGDAIKMIAKAYMLLGDYDNTIAIIQQTLAHIRPGQPLMHLGSGISYAINAAFLSGRWSIIDEITPTLKEMWKQVQYDPSAMSYVVAGYYDVLQVALAREDRETANIAIGILQGGFPDASCQERLLLAAMLAEGTLNIDDDLIQIGVRPLLATAIFCNERGIITPELLLNKLCRHHGESTAPFHCTAIARALAAGDNERLAQAIDAAETYHLIVHAARMRIVLAQRSGDRTQLERARPILEKLGDRQFLRRLEEVDSALSKLAQPSTTYI